MSYLDMDGSKLYYETVGFEKKENETIAFLNGIFMSTSSWRFITPFFVDEYCVLLHDFMGQWNSDGLREPYSLTRHADDLKILLDFLNLKKVHIVGTSYGGEVGLIFSLKYPDRVRSLTVVSSVSEIRPNLKYMALRWLNAAKTRNPEVFVNEWFADVYSEKFISTHPDLWENLVELYRGFDYDSAMRLLEAFMSLETSPITPKLGKITIPVLIIAAENDIVKPVEYSIVMSERIPKNLFFMIPSAGHGVVVEKPKEVSTLILGFLRILNSWEVW